MSIRYLCQVVIGWAVGIELECQKHPLYRNEIDFQYRGDEGRFFAINCGVGAKLLRPKAYYRLGLYSVPVWGRH